ncbi:MAG: type II toxin-antitoxin system HipA family toxin [Tagaea sp.]|nr:type II toxin-antitoxin system HipA family toxin [Tagaea sp.]
MAELICLLDGREVGRVSRTKGRLTFVYAPSWRQTRGAYPLSLSMPIAAPEHAHAAIEPFMWGLLPDNDFVLRRWGASFHVSAQNVYGLIAQVGEDCAGAVQFLTPERHDAFQNATKPQIEWLTETAVAERLRVLRDDASAGRSPADLGQFSLAGAQPKTAFYFDGQRWGVPSGRTPTTHIVKPATPDFDGHAENEHICLSLARALGLAAAQTEVKRFEDVSVIVVTRYDRVDTGRLTAAAAARAAAAAAQAAAAAADGNAALAAQSAADAAAAAADAEVMGAFSKTTPVYRVHQEDFCQAMALHPSKKYQNEGGPGPRQIVDLLRTHAGGGGRDAAEMDTRSFVDALIYNWLIGGTDAHAKNYSVLIGGNGLVRLAPLYDVASIFAYPRFDPLKANLAMKIGKIYRLRDVTWGDWTQFAKESGLPVDAIVHRARTMAAELPDALSSEIAKARAEGLQHVVFDRLSVALTERAGQLLRRL